jgi:hypothetical protein
MIVAVKGILHDMFSMTDMGPLHFFLGLEISQDASSIKLSQAKYARDLMERFHMTDCKSTPTPFLSGVRLEDGRDTLVVENTLYRQLVGILLYLTYTRPDLSYEIGVVSRYMQETHELHWKATKCILRYIQGTISYGIHYVAGCKLDLIGFIDLTGMEMSLITIPPPSTCPSNFIYILLIHCILNGGEVSHDVSPLSSLYFNVH